jgi:hypothetical protein
MQGKALFRLLQKKGTCPRWRDGDSNMQISCPEGCPFYGQDTSYKVYVKAYNTVDQDGKLIKPAGLWNCFKRKSEFCANGGSLKRLLGGDDTPPIDYAQRELEQAIATSAKAKRARGYIFPGETYPLSHLPADHPAYTYWMKRGYDPLILSSIYGVEWCSHGGGYYQNEGRQSFDKEGFLSTTNHFIIPNIMFGEKKSWQARFAGENQPLLWVVTDPGNPAAGLPQKGYWKIPPEDYPLSKKETFVGDPPKRKITYTGRGDDIIDVPPKYFHFFDRDRTIGNFDLARQFKVCVVTEGWTKVWRVGRCAITTFGKQITDRQLRIIGSKWDQVILLLDGDAANLYQDRYNERTQQTVPGYKTKLEDMTEVHAITLTGYNDPGDAPPTEIWRQITQKTGIQEPPYNREQ